MFGPGSFEGDIQGTETRWLSYEARGQMFASGVDQTNTVRMIWLWDTQSSTINAAALTPVLNIPNTGDVLTYYAGNTWSTTNQGNFLSNYNVEQVGSGKRFHVLKDKTFTLVYSNIGTTLAPVYDYIKYADFHVKFKLNKKVGMLPTNVNVTQFANPAQNIVVLYISDSGVAPHPQINMTARISYVSGE